MIKVVFKLLALLIFLLSACSTTKKTTQPAKTQNNNLSNQSLIQKLDSLNHADSMAAAKEKGDTTVITAFENYRPAATILNQLIHTALEVSFDWQKHYLFGKAKITAKPYYYSTDSLILDAKGFDIHEISIIRGNEKSGLTYTYDGKLLNIKLDKTYTRFESFTLFIDYTAKPDELKDEQEGSAAITSHKGLFFINTDGKSKVQPRQLWTQGETEDNSCWFPTIDKPNQRMTTEITMTVDNKDKSLSNGELVSSVINNNGTRSDHWVMKLGIPPYLVMMAVGPFSIIHDTWRGKDVNFYLDSSYSRYAMDIFGKTPQMIEFFSNILRFPFIWNKYDQVVVHDYVSGAMENATATVHGDFLQKTRRELIDDPLSSSEDIISHELFHHWFGDLVTCEAWSQIALNESFATYAEYLWREHEWGKYEADHLMQENSEEYIDRNESQHDLICYDYKDREDVFDLISYQKGGCILHMLRAVIGDSAFFEALHRYLETYKFSAVNANQLLHIFEKTTGEDLNWFFNEWFFNKGYPELTIYHKYDSITHVLTLTVNQTQNLAENPVFKMPLAMDIYHDGIKTRYKEWVNKTKNVYTFFIPSNPQWVDFDANKMLLCVKNEPFTLPEREFEYYHASHYLARFEALTNLALHQNDVDAKKVLQNALNDKYWYLRKYAIEKLSGDSSAEFKKLLLAKITGDSFSQVRAQAIVALSSGYHDKNDSAIFENAINDSSFFVENVALQALSKTNPHMAIHFAHQLKNSESKEVLISVSSVLSELGDDSDNDFFINLSEEITGYDEIPFVSIYSKFLQRVSDSSVNKGVPVLRNLLKTGDNRYVKLYAKNSLQSIMLIYEEREKNLTNQVNDLKSKDPTNAQIAILQSKLNSVINTEKNIKSLTSE